MEKTEKIIMQQFSRLISSFLPITRYKNCLRRKLLKGEIGIMFGRKIIVRR